MNKWSVFSFVACLACSGVALAAAPSAFKAKSDAANRKPATLSAITKPLTPSEALRAFQVPKDLEIEQVLAEPVIAQPLFVDWDERGRMWVVEYRQYPYPAGLKMVSRDEYWRAVYDKVPLPPPHGDRGLDRITIHEDTDGDGRYDKHTTFVDGLNIVTSFAIAADGVWVLNPPYLLFYPDRNHDGVPDGDPEVHLQGFGLEDTHSVVNSLQWGPDGWLYACQGSTVTGHVIRPGLDKNPVHSMGQLIWRYRPKTRTYEIFAEGGGNAFGLEIDSKGRIFSGHNGGDTRGFHYVQGGYYVKGFQKHGPLSNPYAFGYFPAMAHHAVPRFTHKFIIYDDIALPPAYRGRVLRRRAAAGANRLRPDRTGRIVVQDEGPRTSRRHQRFVVPSREPDNWARRGDLFLRLVRTEDFAPRPFRRHDQQRHGADLPPAGQRGRAIVRRSTLENCRRMN